MKIKKNLFLCFFFLPLDANDLPNLSYSLLQLNREIKTLSDQLNYFLLEKIYKPNEGTPAEFAHLLLSYANQIDKKRLKEIIQNIDQKRASNIGLALMDQAPQKFESIGKISYKSPLPGKGDFTSFIALSPDGTFIAVSTFETGLFFFDLATFQKTTEWKQADQPFAGKFLRTVAFHPTQKTIAVAGGKGPSYAIRDNRIYIFQYDPLIENPLAKLLGHTDTVTNITFNKNGSLMASISDDKQAIIWDTATWQKKHILLGHKHYGHSVSFNSDSSLLATGSLDGSVKIWNVENGSLVKTFVIGSEKASGYNFSTASFHPINPHLLVVYLDGTTKIELYSIENSTFKSIKTFSHPRLDIISLAFDASGNRLIARNYDQKIFCWNTEDLKMIGYIFNFEKTLSTVCPAIFNKTGDKIITAYRNEPTLAIWNIFNIPSDKFFLSNLIDQL